MNFSFEGNFKPRRNINLGGVKNVDDKRSLMAKAQAERKAREQERLKLKSVQRIQAFCRGRKVFETTRQELRIGFEQLITEASSAQYGLSAQQSNCITLARQLLLFYQPEKDGHYLDQFISFLLSPVPNTSTNFINTLFDIKDKTILDSWIWLICLLVKKALIKAEGQSSQMLSLLLDPATYPQGEQSELRIRIVTFALCDANLLSAVRERIFNSSDPYMERILSQLASLNPPYYYSNSPLTERYKRSHRAEYLTRPTLIRMINLEIFTQPFLLDHISSQTVETLVIQLPLKHVLDTVPDLLPGDNKLADLDIAGLLMNIMELGDVKSGKYLDCVLTPYAKAIQLLLARLPVSYLVDPSATNNEMDIMHQDGENSSDEDDDVDEDRDIVMKEVGPSITEPVISPSIRTRLEAIFSSERINNLLYRFMNLGSNEAIKNVQVIQSIANLFNSLMLKWPAKKDSILNTFLYKTFNTTHLLKTLWDTWSTSKEAILFKNDNDIMNNLSEATRLISSNKESFSILYLLCEVYARLLLTIGDDEFLDKHNRTTHSNPLSLEQVVELSRQLKNISFVMFWRANVMDLNLYIGSTGIQLTQLRSTVTHLLQHIHMRDSRRPFCPQDHWLIPHLDTDNFSSEAVAEEFNLESELQQEKNTPLRPLRMLSKGRLAVISPRLGLLNNIPFVVPFEQRVEIFRMFVQNDKKRNNIEEMYVRPKASVTVRRDHMFEDGFASLNALDVELKNKVAISFVDKFGLEEAGIDGGGVFKEFLTGLSAEAFNTNFGLFVATPDQLLYPNPSSYATEARQLEYFRFIGLVIGKAVYEGILLDVPFADFFLKKCLGKVNYLDDLASLDPELYKGLLAVKNFEGNVEDLSLDFTSTHLENGKSVNVELIPNGANTPVTNQNRIQYIYLIANYRLNLQISKQCGAFFRGLSTIVDIKWLRMFNQQELQIVLGGASVPIDLEDLRAHTVLGGYTENDKTVKNFWKAVQSFNNELRMKFVKFVTSCSRPPLLGFKELVPQFSLRNAGVDNERFPTSSTCVNLLKLPNYSSYEILREKLVYAITADAGFDLS